ncbi:MAG: hypothetical protein FWE98_03890 [Oscillospiraceae bacterium]|nr:hypothetical protein [Oscillospiraceae bacterium]
MTCPNCKSTLDERSNYCNNCGAAQLAPEQAPPNAQSFGDSPMGGSAADGEPYRRYFQPPTGDADPQSPGFGGGDGKGGISFLGPKTYLILSICCFGWAALIGLSRAVNLLNMLSYWSFFSWGLVTGVINVAIHFVLPLVGGFVLLNMHKRNLNEK